MYFGYYYDENNERKAIATSCPPVAYAGNGKLIHKDRGRTIFSEINMQIINWMHEHHCLNKDLEKMIYGTNHCG